jgi:hypothetical protein
MTKCCVVEGGWGTADHEYMVPVCPSHPVHFFRTL